LLLAFFFPAGSSASELYYAVLQEDAEHIRVLLSEGADPNVAVNNVTPLQAAYLSGREDLIALLVESGADPTATAGVGERSLIDWYISEPERDWIDEFDLYIERSTDHHLRWLQAAIMNERLELIRRFLRIMPDDIVNRQLPMGSRAHGMAAMTSEDVFVTLLKGARASTLSDPNLTGEPILHIAVRLGYLDGVRELLQPPLKIDPHQKGPFGKTATMVAVSEKQYEITEVLVERLGQSAVAAEDAFGMTAQDYASDDPRMLEIVGSP
jgi:ankyrin repeat protein